VKKLGRGALISLGMMTALFNLSGCGRGDHGAEPYHWEHGDRVDRDGHRDVRWCDSHHEDEHCH
jgi:hypothetical protein